MTACDRNPSRLAFSRRMIRRLVEIGLKAKPKG
jgi:hypothetical protein